MLPFHSADTMKEALLDSRAQGVYLPEQGYDLVAEHYLKSHWNKFWNRNELPIIDNIIRSKRRKALDGALDIGTGAGRYAHMLQKYYSFVDAVDISKRMLDCARKRHPKSRYPRIDFQKNDIQKLRLSRKYDVIVAARVFSHIEKPLDTIQNLVDSALLDGGLLIITDIHRLHSYLHTNFSVGEQNISINTFKRSADEIHHNISGMNWVFYKRFYYNDLLWKPTGSRFKSLDPSGVRPIFYALVGKK